MDEIIDRVRRGEATPQEIARLAVWRQESPDNEHHYQQAVALLDALGRRAQGVHLTPPPATEIIARRRRTTASVTPFARAWRVLPWGIAAAAVFLFLRATRSGNPGEAPRWTPTEIVTGADELATVHLPDGSVARLGPRSRLRLVDAPDERVVSLEGRAFFAVAKMPDRPFRVTTRGGDALALGTRFDVSTDERGLRLLVVEGRVALSARDNRTEVVGGEAANLIDGRASEGIAVSDPALLQWMGQFLAFQSTPLSHVAAEIERVYGVRVLITDSTLASETVSAAFTDETIHEVAGVVCAVIGHTCAITASAVTISP